eukprot:SM000034S12690  [mRNA]  locus=s34:251043:252554:+ [translate_table: standard]
MEKLATACALLCLLLVGNWATVASALQYGPRTRGHLQDWQLDDEGGGDLDVELERRLLADGGQDPYSGAVQILSVATTPKTPQPMQPYVVSVDLAGAQPGHRVVLHIKGSDGFLVTFTACQVTASKFPGGRGKCVQRIPGNPVVSKKDFDYLVVEVQAASTTQVLASHSMTVNG